LGALRRRSDTVLTLDRLSVRGRLVQGWGWALHPERRIAGVSLLRGDAAGAPQVLTEYGVCRADVQVLYPDAPDAPAAGFHVFGMTDPPIRPGERLRWSVDFVDGGTEQLRADVDITFLNGAPGPVERFPRIAQALRQGSEMLRRWHSVPALAAAAPAEPIARAGEFAPAVLVFDQDLGGGANFYRRKIIERYVAEGQSCLLVKWSLSSLSYEIEAYGGPRDGLASAVYERQIDTWLEAVELRHVVINGLVSYPAPLRIVRRLLSSLEQSPATVTVLMHDFHSLCPSWTLLNDQGKFCGVPTDAATCEACFRASRIPFKSVLWSSSMAEWRRVWGRLLARASEVRCFSESSRSLVLRAYPELVGPRLTVVPHRLETSHNRAASYDITAPINVGILGAVLRHKGGDVVKALSAEIRRQRQDVRLTVIGTLASDTTGGNLTVTGPYLPTDLPELIERHGVNVCLFPSIWPETFSFVCEEIMQMGLPLIAFDLGAPAERIRHYPQGRLVPVCDAERLLSEIVAFVAELRSRKG